MKYKKGDILVNEYNCFEDIEVLEVLDNNYLKVRVGENVEAKISSDTLECTSYHIKKEDMREWESLKNILEDILEHRESELDTSKNSMETILASIDTISDIDSDNLLHAQEYVYNIIAYSSNIKLLKRILKIMEKIERE